MNWHGHVLLVSPYDDDRAMYGDFLRHHHLTVDTCDTPESALEVLEDAHPDVVVCDFSMPPHSMVAPEFIRRLRDRTDETTSIIVISGYVRQEDRRTARDAGADLFLDKPALPRDLLYEVRRALALRSEGSRLRWNWVFLPAVPPALERRRSSSPPPLSLAADKPRRS